MKILLSHRTFVFISCFIIGSKALKSNYLDGNSCLQPVIMNSNEELFCHYSGLPSPMAYVKENASVEVNVLNEMDIDRIIEMAWEDRTPFDAIKVQFNLSEEEVKELMKRELRFSSYKNWRKRVEACKTKHSAKRSAEINRFKSNAQRRIL